MFDEQLKKLAKATMKAQIKLAICDPRCRVRYARLQKKVKSMQRRFDAVMFKLMPLTYGKTKATL